MRLAAHSPSSATPPGTSRAEATRRVAQAYFRAWTTGDVLGVSMTLSPEATFTAPIAVTWPEGVAVRLLSEVADGDQVIQMFEAATARRRRVRVWERLRIASGQVVEVEMMFDTVEMRRFMGLD